MTKREFINRVLQIMNENGLTDVLGNSMIGGDVAQPDRYIESSYVDAWRRCVKVLPRQWFRSVSFIGSTVYPDLTEGNGYVLLPEDFYLLSVFQMQGWQKPVYEATLENDRISAIQTNPYTRGSEIRPVCTITTSSAHTDSSGNPRNQLNYYSLRRGLASHTVSKALYVPVAGGITNIGPDTDLGLSLQAIEPLAYLSASTVFTMFEKFAVAQALEGKAVEMFPGLARARGTGQNMTSTVQ
jgi:hypothetical protein